MTDILSLSNNTNYNLSTLPTTTTAIDSLAATPAYSLSGNLATMNLNVLQG